MNFSDIRKKVSKIDYEVKDLEIMALAEMAINGESVVLKEIVSGCNEIEARIEHLKNVLQDTILEEQEEIREDWEEEQKELEEYFYEENRKELD